MKFKITIEEEQPVEFESMAQLEEWLDRERDRIRRQEFHEHLEDASAEVAKWPEWKRNILGRAI